MAIVGTVKIQLGNPSQESIKKLEEIAERTRRPKPPPPPTRYFRDTLFGQVETKESIKAREDWHREIGKR